MAAWPKLPYPENQNGGSPPLTSDKDHIDIVD